MTPSDSKQQVARESLDDLVSDLKKDALLDDVFVTFDRSSSYLRPPVGTAASEKEESPYEDFEALYGKITPQTQELPTAKSVPSELNSDEDVSKAIDSLATRRSVSFSQTHSNLRSRPRSKGKPKSKGAGRCKNCAMRFPFYSLRCKYCGEKVVTELYYYSMIFLAMFIFVIVTWVIITSKTYK